MKRILVYTQKIVYYETRLPRKIKKKKEINTKEGTKQLHIREYSKKKEKGEKMNDTKKRELKGH